jgi:hypothetical protein
VDGGEGEKEKYMVVVVVIVIIIITMINSLRRLVVMCQMAAALLPKCDMCVWRRDVKMFVRVPSVSRSPRLLLMCNVDVVIIDMVGLVQ